MFGQPAASSASPTAPVPPPIPLPSFVSLICPDLSRRLEAFLCACTDMDSDYTHVRDAIANADSDFFAEFGTNGTAVTMLDDLIDCLPEIEELKDYKEGL